MLNSSGSKEIKRRGLTIPSLRHLSPVPPLALGNSPEAEKNVSISITTDTEASAVPPRSNAIIKLLLARNLTLVTALCEAVKQDEHDDLCHALLPIFEEHQQSLHLLKWGIKAQIYETSSASTLFRGPSVAARLVSLFCKEHGKEYLQAVLHSVIFQICNGGVSVEVDPIRLETGEKVRSNQKLLKTTCKKLLSVILNSADMCPRAMRYIFHYSQTVVAERFPEMTQQIVAGFFFLRFLCPALVSPENYGLALTAEKITSKSRRSLVLISKVLQNLANDVEFGDKEPYMTAMNHFIIRKRKSLQAFFNQLAEQDDEGCTPPPAAISSEIREEALRSLLRVLTRNFDAIGRLLVRDNKIPVWQKLEAALRSFYSGNQLGRRAMHKEILLRKETQEAQETARQSARASRAKRRELLEYATNRNEAQALVARETQSSLLERRKGEDKEEETKEAKDKEKAASEPIADVKEVVGSANGALQSGPSSTHLRASSASREEVVVGDPDIQKMKNFYDQKILELEHKNSQMMMILSDTLLSSEQAQNAYETEIKLLKLKLAAQIAANKALDERIKKIKQNHMEHVEMIVEERLQRRLMEKREKMSEVMNNFLTQFGPGGVDLKARRSPRKSQAGRTKRSASLSVTQTRINGNSAPENGGGASSAPDREPRDKDKARAKTVSELVQK